MTKNEIIAQTLLHMVKQLNKIGVVEKFYMVDVLTVYSTYVAKIINVALNLQNDCKKIYWPLFVDTV